jgi:hypothetical protein
MSGCPMESGAVRRDSETSQFADHLTRSHFLRFFADGRPAFLVPHAVVKNLPNQTTQSVVIAPIAWGVFEPLDESSVRDRQEGLLGFERGVGGLIETRLLRGESVLAVPPQWAIKA